VPAVASAVDVTVNVIDGNGVPLSGGFRWLLQEDSTYQVQPGLQVPNGGDPNHLPLSMKFHSSHNPVVSNGSSATSSAVITLPDSAKPYFVSILPNEAHSMGGTPVKPGQTIATVTCNVQPIPTAQISVRVFEDNQVINNVQDQPGELGLANFKIIL
jgi:hypothetical protein